MRDPQSAVSERDARVSNSKREARVMSQTQPTLEIRVSILHEVRVLTKKHETCIQNGMSSRHKKLKAVTPRG